MASCPRQLSVICSGNFVSFNFYILNIFKKNCIINNWFRFCVNNIELPRSFKDGAKARIGWVIKSPFTTHSYGRIYCYSIYQLEAAYRRLCNRSSLAGVPVFFFVEPRYGNRHEVKVVLAEDDATGASLPPFFSKHHISRASDFQKFTP